MTRPERLRAALRGTPRAEWVDAALTAAAERPETIGRSFTQAGRRAGRTPLPGVPGWTADEAVRVLLLAALPADRAEAEIGDLYRHGDADEKRAVLKALPALAAGGAPGTALNDTALNTTSNNTALNTALRAAALPLLHDAIRTNDARLLAAALGPYARHLDQAAWRQAVLKCVFMGVPLTAVDGLEERADRELAAMLAGFADERAAAGRPMPADAAALLDRLTREES